jgi:YHS domain-containing protein
MEVPGRAEHQCEWQGVVYRLASAEAQARFEANPGHFAPANGGFDVTLAVHQGQEVPGNLEHAVWYRRQLYLFRDAACLKSFKANPAKFVK